MLLKALLTLAAATALAGCDNAKNDQNATASTAPTTAPVTVASAAAASTGAAAASSAASGAAEAKPNATASVAISTDAKVTTKSGLKYTILVPGKADAKVAKAGDSLSMHYTGWLTNGKKFDSSLDRNEPFSFTLGQGQVIKGWDEGVAGMKVGEKRKLVIPSDLGYGERGAGADIPPGATLIFEVELLDIKS